MCHPSTPCRMSEQVSNRQTRLVTGAALGRAGLPRIVTTGRGEDTQGDQYASDEITSPPLRVESACQTPNWCRGSPSRPWSTR